ncbi:MAG: hypothetical protein ACOX68_04345 [Candidatus Limivicinus sp.]
MTEINKQKFLAELGKLLTFMYEEDRQTALSMYEELFEGARDEQAVIKELVSATRQAVIIARSYNARERKLQVEAQSKDESEYADDGETPQFVSTIEKIRQSVLLQLSAGAEEGPVNAKPAAPEPEKNRENTVPSGIEAPKARLPETETAEEPKAEKAVSDAVPAEAGEKDAAAGFGEAFSSDIEPAAETGDRGLFEEESGDEDLPETEKKLSTGLLVLFLLVFIPLGLIGAALLLIPTLICLVLAVASVYLGISAISSAFGCFSIFADVMVVLGIGIIILALSLLFAWLFIWFIGGAIAGLINAIIKLGARVCYKEVPAE